MRRIIVKMITGLAVVMAVAGCVPKDTPTPTTAPRFTVVSYVYETDTDATEFISVEAGLLVTAVTVETGEGAEIFDIGDGQKGDTLDLENQILPWKYEFYEATEPLNVSVSVALILEENQTLACHALAGPELTGQILTLDEAVGPGPVGVTCDFVIF